MRKWFSLLLAFLCGVSSCLAQESVVEAAAKARAAKAAREALPADAPSREQILKLFDVMQVRTNVETMLENMKQQARSGAEQGFRHRVPNPTPHQMQELRGMIDDIFREISVDDLIESVIPVYQRHLTQSDVDAIAAFYASPVGQKFLHEQPAMMREGMQAAASQQQQRMAAIMKKLDQRIDQMIQEQQTHAPRSRPSAQ